MQALADQISDMIYGVFRAFLENQERTECYRLALNAPSHRSRRPAAVLAQSSILKSMGSIASPHRNTEPGAITAFADKTFGLVVLISFYYGSG